MITTLENACRFGKDVVREMNRVGMLVDLSHVGDKTTLDAFEWSEKPVAITHANAHRSSPTSATTILRRRKAGDHARR